MRCFLALAANIAIGVMAGFGVADAVVATGWIADALRVRGVGRRRSCRRCCMSVSN